jgi:dUTP pyrophosphatase
MMYLKIYVKSDNLRMFYIDAIKKHNEKMTKPYPDSGFDLFVPEAKNVPAHSTQKIDLEVKCEAYYESKDNHWISYYDNDATIYYDIVNRTRTLEKPPNYDNMKISTGFYMYPRSSVSKTPLRLSNSVGIIDAGYRGNLGAFVDNISANGYNVEKGTRLFQICAPNLEPIHVELVSSENDLGNSERGSGGFGSTGN